MDKIMAYSFCFPNGDLCCVGSEWAIKDLLNNFIIQKELRNDITFRLWSKRMIGNHIYCRFVPKGIHGFYIFLLHYFTMKKHSLWITEEAYDEALLFTNTKKVSELLELTKEEVEEIKNNSVWNGKFLY